MSHGQIYEIDEEVEPAPPIHEHCRCIIAALEAIIAGKATNNGTNGAIYGSRNLANCRHTTFQKGKRWNWVGKTG